MSYVQVGYYPQLYTSIGDQRERKPITLESQIIAKTLLYFHVIYRVGTTELTKSGLKNTLGRA